MTNVELIATLRQAGHDYTDKAAARIAKLEAALATARRDALAEIKQDTDELIEQGRKDGMEYAAQIALQHPESDRGGYSGIMRTVALCTAMEIAATIRAALAGGKDGQG